MQRIGFVLKVKTELLEEYKGTHKNVWPEMQQGDRDYVIAGIQRFFDEGHVRSSLMDAQ